MQKLLIFYTSQVIVFLLYFSSYDAFSQLPGYGIFICTSTEVVTYFLDNQC
jgi:hypothetical protein